MLITSERSLGKMLLSLKGEKRLVVDTETTGLRMWQGDVVCGISITTPQRALEDRGWYLPFRHELGYNLPERCIDDVASVLENAVCTGWNFKFDVHMLSNEGVQFNKRVEDVMLGAHLMNENEHFMGGNYRLKEWCDRYVKEGSSSKEKALALLLTDRGLGKGDMWRLSGKEVDDYATEDVVLTEKARRIVRRALVRWDLWDMWQEVNEYLMVTADMERHGMLIDMDRLEALLSEAYKEKKRTLRRLVRLAGYEINPNSSPQVCSFLGVDSSDAEVLDEMEQTPEVKAIRDLRAWGKVIGSYYEAYKTRVDENNVLHPNINLHGTIAGRPSASDPNMQAVPRSSDIYKVKQVFVSRPGYSLVSADYSQAELRLAAHYAEDPNMLEALKSDDIHQATADQMNIPRDYAKRINFGVVYGVGAKSLSTKLRIAYAEARRFLDVYLKRFSHIRPLRFSLEEHAYTHKYIRLWTGRVRRYNCRMAEPRKALSNLIQGGVAEIMRHALIRLSRSIKDGTLHDVRILLQVHDQIIFEVPNRHLDSCVTKIKTAMEDFKWLRSPFRVDVSVGERWSDLKKWTPTQIRRKR